MNMKIVADSTANLLSLEGVPYASVPLKIVTDHKEYVDNAALDPIQMMEELAQYKGKSGTSCPNVNDWLDAFGDAEYIFTVALTKALSGSHNAAMQAKEVYEEEHPGRKVYNLDTLTTGPKMTLIIEKLKELMENGLSFEEIQGKIEEYMKKTHFLFMLESLDNLAKNGRVPRLVAKAVGVLNIRVVGKASNEGTFQQLHKCRGEKKGLEALLKEIKAHNFGGGKVRIAHSNNLKVAQTLKELILENWPKAEISIVPCGGLCSYYAEKNGLLLGIEE